MQFVIRQAASEDASAIARVHVASWEAAYRGLIPDETIRARTVEVRTGQWAKKVLDPGSLVLVACDAEGNVQGFARAQLLDSAEEGFQSYLQALYVGPQFWGRGIGRALLRAVCSRLSAVGVRNLALRTLRLGGARRFYERLGARMVPGGIAQDAGAFDDVVYAFHDIASMTMGDPKKVLTSRLGQVEITNVDTERYSLEELTSLLNRAYTKLANMGLNYVAATQDVETTRKRIGGATACWIARRGDAVVGTVCYYSKWRFSSEPHWYAREDVCHFAQFAVEPELQRAGVGSALLQVVQQRALLDGKTELACDTAMGATHLIEYYRKRGYREVGRHQWPHAKYESVVLSKTLARATFEPLI